MNNEQLDDFPYSRADSKAFRKSILERKGIPHVIKVLELARNKIWNEQDYESAADLIEDVVEYLKSTEK